MRDLHLSRGGEKETEALIKDKKSTRQMWPCLFPAHLLYELDAEVLPV